MKPYSYFLFGGKVLFCRVWEDLLLQPYIQYAIQEFRIVRPILTLLCLAVYSTLLYF